MTKLTKNAKFAIFQNFEIFEKMGKFPADCRSIRGSSGLRNAHAGESNRTKNKIRKFSKKLKHFENCWILSDDPEIEATDAKSWAEREYKDPGAAAGGGVCLYSVAFSLLLWM